MVRVTADINRLSACSNVYRNVRGRVGIEAETKRAGERGCYQKTTGDEGTAAAMKAITTNLTGTAKSAERERKSSVLIVATT